MSAPFQKPYPETTQICVICGQPWEDHIKLTYWRMQIMHDDEMPTDEDVENAVSFLECIHLLKVANQGPPGPAGPMGPMGMSR